MRKSFRVWAAPLALAAIAVGVVLAAPLASPNKAAAGPIISGARSLSDQVAVNFAAVPPGHETSDVHILAFNDLHGTLQAGTNNLYGHFAGGAAYLAKVVKDKQAQYGDNEATVFAGDNIGAAPLENGLFHEEPIVIASNLMHVDFASVGNHEFDKGSTELLRIQNGGCHPDGCNGAPYALPSGGTTNVYPGADFQYLSANVVRNATGETLFPATATKQFTADDGKRKFRVGFIGEVLQSTPSIVTPTGVAGLTFQDEADAANRAVAALADKGVKIPVLVIHQGGFQSGAAVLNGCAGNLAGSDIAAIADRLDPAIKVIVSAHTHAEYRCTYTSNGVTRLITSASSFGRVLSDITLTVDNKNDKLLSVGADNILVDNARNLRTSSSTVRIAAPEKEDPAVAAVVRQYTDAAAPLANRVIGHIQGDLTRATSPFGEETLGDVIADGQLAATAPPTLGGAVIAFMNPGGIRADLFFATRSGAVTYGDAFTVQPFGNSLVTKTMTGDMIHRVLEQQFLGCQAPGAVPAPATGRILQISSSFKYEQKFDAPTCAAKVGRMWINGVEVVPATPYRVTMNNFLATGGDGFGVFNEGTEVLGGAQDIDAWVDYFQSKEPAGIAVPALNRIVAKP
ncbi:MAG: bifunctional metallophosphatase/5'-nucleotidase [Gaiellaceae bacterium]